MPLRMFNVSKPDKVCAVSQRVEKSDYGFVDLAWPLLLCPVAALRQDDGLPELRRELWQIGHEIPGRCRAEHQVTLAGDIQRRNGHARAGEGRKQLPAAIDVAIPVQGAPKTG